MLDRTFSVALARGSCVAGTLSGDIQDSVSRSGGVVELSLKTASRSLATVSAANMSPVPLKKQSSCGTSSLKRRAEQSDRMVEPTTERTLRWESWLTVEVPDVEKDAMDDEDEGKSPASWREVTIIWGTL